VIRSTRRKRNHVELFEAMVRIPLTVRENRFGSPKRRGEVRVHRGRELEVSSHGGKHPGLHWGRLGLRRDIVEILKAINENES